MGLREVTTPFQRYHRRAAGSSVAAVVTIVCTVVVRLHEPMRRIFDASDEPIDLPSQCAHLSVLLERLRQVYQSHSGHWPHRYRLKAVQ